MKFIETKCDFCKIITKECEELQIGDNLFDLCSSCMSKINKIISGSGRPVVQIKIPGQMEGIGGWLRVVTSANSTFDNLNLQSYQTGNNTMNSYSTVEA